MEVRPAAIPIPVVQGFEFTIGGRISKIDKLRYVPTDEEVTALLAKILKDGVPCETPTLRCDVQGGTTGGYVNTQCQLGGSELNVPRSKASKQSTSFTQVNITQQALNNRTSSQALQRAHRYSWQTTNVVTVQLAGGAATVSVPEKSTYIVICSNCKQRKTYTSKPTSENLIRCNRCKQEGTLSEFKG